MVILVISEASDAASETELAGEGDGKAMATRARGVGSNPSFCFIFGSSGEQLSSTHYPGGGFGN